APDRRPRVRPRQDNHRAAGRAVPPGRPAVQPEPGLGAGQRRRGANAIPDDGIVEGTVRCLDDEAWHVAPDLLKALIDSVASAYGVVAELTYVRNVPPTVNEAISTAMVEAAADQVLGADAVVAAPQSLGGEDFAWYLESIPGALARLGTRKPGSG